MVSEQRSCDHRPRAESCISSSHLGILCDYVTYAPLRANVPYNLDIYDLCMARVSRLTKRGKLCVSIRVK